MTNFHCCKSATFPSSYHICINCYKVFHRSCVLKNKKKYTLLDGFKIKCCDDENTDCNAEKSVLEETILDLTETSNLKDQHILNMRRDHDKFMEEVIQREEEFNDLLSKHKLLLDKANEEIARLRLDIIKITSKDTTTESTQTDKKIFSAIMTQTNEEVITNESPDTPFHTMNELPSSNSKMITPKRHRQPQVLIVAGEYGEDLCFYLRNKLEKYYVHTFLKPKATNQELLSTVLQQSRGFTCEDYVIFWPNLTGSYLVNDFLLELQHTNPILLTSPYRFDLLEANIVIYNNNISLYKEMHAKSIDLKQIIEVNNILRRTNYNRSGCWLKKIGKKYIAIKLTERISTNRIHNKKLTCYGRDHNGISHDGLLYPDPVPGSVAIEPKYAAADPTTTPNQVQDICSRSNFLYPRLSQDAPRD